MPTRRAWLTMVTATCLPIPGLVHAADDATDQWGLWCERFVLPEGRVVDTGNGGVSHSEGQGYGMLLAVAFDDAELFERLWRWTVAHLGVRDDGLFAWRFDPRASEPVADRNAAIDGDLLIAWALARAAAAWGNTDHEDGARALAKAIRSHATVSLRGSPVLLPGPAGFVRPEGPIVNLSYYVFPALRMLATIDPEGNWPAIRFEGRKLLERLRFGVDQLPPDWAILTDPPQPAPEFPPVFGFNALRIPLYVAWSEPDAARLVAPIRRFWDRYPDPPPASIELGLERRTLPGVARGIEAIRALLRARDAPTLAVPFPSIRDESDYYAATLVMLARLAYLELRR